MDIPMEPSFAYLQTCGDCLLAERAANKRQFFCSIAGINVGREKVACSNIMPRREKSPLRKEQGAMNGKENLAQE